MINKSTESAYNKKSYLYHHGEDRTFYMLL